MPTASDNNENFIYKCGIPTGFLLGLIRMQRTFCIYDVLMTVHVIQKKRRPEGRLLKHN